jgi:hypothetical protein
MKSCGKCNISKKTSYFSKKKSSKDGLNNSCKECVNNITRLYYLKNREKIINQKMVYASENQDLIKTYQCEYRKDNKEYIIKYREENSEYYKKWWVDNRDKAKLYDKKYREKFPHVRACRNALKSCLERIGLDKTQRTIELLKYTTEEFKIHIESLFTDGMNWSNYGKWHIDHIKPVSKFNTNTPVYIINSLDNLQPLWAKDNLSKSNKINV